MTARVLFNAIVQLTLMAAVIGAYAALARRFQRLWHPAAVAAAVTSVSIVVAVSAELLFGGGWPAVPAMLRRSALGGLAWGLLIAGVVWAARSTYIMLAKRPRR